VRLLQSASGESTTSPYSFFFLRAGEICNWLALKAAPLREHFAPQYYFVITA
jgi:hypothetical protein